MHILRIDDKGGVDKYLNLSEFSYFEYLPKEINSPSDTELPRKSEIKLFWPGGGRLSFFGQEADTIHDRLNQLHLRGVAEA